MDIPVISLRELWEMIDNKRDYVLIDVREQHELSHGMIPTAKCVPLSDFAEALALSPEEFRQKYGFELSAEDNLIFYCRTGARSEKATELALQRGFVKARNYKGSAWEWHTVNPIVQRYGAPPL